MSILDKLKGIAAKANKAAAEFENAVDELRKRIADLSDERANTADAPLSRPEIEGNIDRVLDGLEAEARGWLGAGAFYMPADYFRRSASLDALQRGAPLGALVLLGGRETVRAALLAEVLANARETGIRPLSTPEREAELVRLDREIDQAERAEEELIRAAEDAGVRIWRRADARPEIFLAETV